jgi:hypothetical protein
MLNPLMHSEIQFKQQKLTILFRFTSPDSDQKSQKVERLANTILIFTKQFKVVRPGTTV